jgi:hypothetical protein
MFVRIAKKLGDSKSTETTSASFIRFYVTFKRTSALSSFRSSVRIGRIFVMVYSFPTI